MIDPRDPFERLQRRAAGENGLRHLHESLVWHQHSGFEERFQNVQDLEVGSELALDGEGRRRDPAVEVCLRPVPLDCCREPVGAETDDRPGGPVRTAKMSKPRGIRGKRTAICVRPPSLDENSFCVHHSIFVLKNSMNAVMWMELSE
jgi:hypothetical protein